MRQATSVNTKQAQPQPPHGTPGVLECAARDELCLITRDAATRTGALTGLLVACNAAQQQLDVVCAYGTAPSNDRRSPAAKLSGFARRVRESGRGACEPIAAAPRRALVAAGTGACTTYAVGAPLRTPAG